MWPQESAFSQDPCIADVHDNHYMSGYDTPIQYNIEDLDAFKLPVQIEIPSTTPKIGQKRKRTSASKDSEQNQQVGLLSMTLECAARTDKNHQISYSQRNSPRSTGSCTPGNATPNVRKHYAVEKRYRSTLNDRYATLARIVSHPDTQTICRSECTDWEVPYKLECGTATEGGKDPSKRQSKTTTLSVAIDTIALLDRACNRKARELQSLLERLNGIVQVANDRVESSRQ